MQPKVSLVVPVYKVEAYLEAFLRSVTAQTSREFELILVDDASPDRCGEICDRYAGQHDFCVVLHHPVNRGVGAARNTALEAARGRFIAFADPDDLLCENYISALVEAQARADADLVVASYWSDYVQAGTLVRSEQKTNPLQTDSTDCLSALCALYDKKLLFQGHYKLYRTDIIRENGLRFSDEVRLEDLLFNFAYYQHVRTVACISTPIYHYQNFISLSERATAMSAYLDARKMHRIACKMLEQGTALANSFAPDGDPDQIEQLKQAMRVHYLMYTYNNVLDVSRDPGSLLEKHRIIREIARDYSKRQNPCVSAALQRKMDRTFHFLLMHQLDLPLLAAMLAYQAKHRL